MRLENIDRCKLTDSFCSPHGQEKVGSQSNIQNNTHANMNTDALIPPPPVLRLLVLSEILYLSLAVYQKGGVE